MTLKAKQNWQIFYRPSLSTWNAGICLLVSSIFLARNRSGETKAALNPTCLCPSAPGHRWICWRAGNIFGHDTETMEKTYGLFFHTRSPFNAAKVFQDSNMNQGTKSPEKQIRFHNPDSSCFNFSFSVGRSSAGGLFSEFQVGLLEICGKKAQWD